MAGKAKSARKVARGKVAGAKRAAAKRSAATRIRGKKKTTGKKTVKGSAKVKRKKAGATTKAATGKRTTKRVASKKVTAKKTASTTATARRLKKKSAKKTVAKKVAGKAMAKKGARALGGLVGKKTALKKAGSKRATAKKRPVGIFARRNARSATSQDPIQFPEESRKIPKTHLSRKELKEFRDLLLQKRRELAGDVHHMSRTSTSMGRGFGEKPAMPIHMADVGTDNWEHEFTLGLIENEQGRIRQIDESLQRIAQRTYGVCVATFKPINRARLRAKPWAKYCIEYARAREEGRVR